MKLYLAAPFFTPPEREAISKIEDVLSQIHGVDLFSPRKQHTKGPPNLRDANVRREINRVNLEALAESLLVVCWLDRILGVDTRLVLEKGSSERPLGPLDRAESRTLLNPQPDIGTVWEMGYATAIGLPIVGFTFGAASKLNLMITENLDCLACGLQELRDTVETFLHGGELPEFSWKGESE